MFWLVKFSETVDTTGRHKRACIKKLPPAVGELPPTPHSARAFILAKTLQLLLPNMTAVDNAGVHCSTKSFKTTKSDFSILFIFQEF